MEHRGLTINIELIKDDEQEALLAELTELVEKYGFTEYSTEMNYERDTKTFYPEKSLELVKPSWEYDPPQAE